MAVASRPISMTHTITTITPVDSPCLLDRMIALSASVVFVPLDLKPDFSGMVGAVTVIVMVFPRLVWILDSMDC